MFGLIFYILFGLVFPSYSNTTSGNHSNSNTTYSTADDGPGGEVGDNPPKP